MRNLERIPYTINCRVDVFFPIEPLMSGPQRPQIVPKQDGSQ